MCRIVYMTQFLPVSNIVLKIIQQIDEVPPYLLLAGYMHEWSSYFFSVLKA